MPAIPFAPAAAESISWERFEQLTKQLAAQVEAFEPQLILGLARGGLFPATMLSFMLHHELFPIRLTYGPDATGDHFVWLVPPPPKVAGRRVLVVHEVAKSGRTLHLAAKGVRALGAAQVRTAVLYAHTWANPRPDYVAYTSDALILSPWDREVLLDGQWSTHPEWSASLHERPDVPPAEVGP